MLIVEFINDLEILRSQINNCQKCNLCAGRTNVVFDAGNPNASIMLIGEGPGENEDLTGKPFVGRAGQLLDKMLEAVGLSRDKDVYIANIVKCRPPKNRDPEQQEKDACIGYLKNQIHLVNPKIIVTLGRIASQEIIDENFKVTVDHGKWYKKDGIWIMGTYHPAALLRFPKNKPIAFQDLLSIRDRIKNID